MDELRYIAASLVGAGVDRDSLDEALQHDPHFIACDAGTTDAGPFSLGSGRPAFPREAVKSDLALLLEAGRRAGVPVLIGSAGTAGSDDQVDWTFDIAKEITREAGVKLRTAVIYAEQDKDYLIEMLRQDRILPLEAAPHLDEARIRGSSRIVGMMGAEPLQMALAEGVDFVLAGRCSDTALYAALVDQGLLVRTTDQKTVMLVASKQVNNYDISEQGRAAWVADPEQPGFGNFCYGRRKVTSIDTSTPTTDPRSRRPTSARYSSFRRPRCPMPGLLPQCAKRWGSARVTSTRSARTCTAHRC